jgi:hypothetical protein
MVVARPKTVRCTRTIQCTALALSVQECHFTRSCQQGGLVGIDQKPPIIQGIVPVGRGSFLSGQRLEFQSPKIQSVIHPVKKNLYATVTIFSKG